MNLGFKNIPLVLFLALLIVLVISVYFGKTMKKWTEQEGYVSYNYSTVPLTMVSLTPYANNRSVMKLYDNFYYDKQSSYMIEMSGNSYEGNVAGNVSPPSVNSLTVYCPRELHVGGPYSVSSLNSLANIPERQTPAVLSQNGMFVLSSADKNTVFIYTAADQDTYIHTIDMAAGTNPINAYSVGIIRANDTTQIRHYGLPDGAYVVDTSLTSNAIDLVPLPDSEITDSGNVYGTAANISVYDASATVRYITKQFAVDSSNGNLLYIDASDSAYVYPRQTAVRNGVYTDTAPTHYTKSSPMAVGSAKKSLDNTPYYPWWAITPDKKYYIYSVQVGYSTYCVVFAKSSTIRLGLWLAYIMVRNSATGTITPTTPTPTPDSSNPDYAELLSRVNDIADMVEQQKREKDLEDDREISKGDKGKGDKGKGKDKNDYMNEYNWFKFWNGVAQTDDLSAVFAASNLIPKTAVIPPVCPTCPSCAGSQCGGGVCANCGGQGGSGTLHGNRFADYISRFGSGTKSLIEDTGRGTKDLIEDTGRGAKDLLKDTASGTVGLAKDAASGTVGLARETVGGTVGLAREAVGGTVGLAKEVVGGTLGLAKDVVGGLNPVQLGGGGYPMQNQYQSVGGSGMIGGSPFQQPTPVSGVPGADPYSYYGKLPNKASSNYIPITADFSAFSK